MPILKKTLLNVEKEESVNKSMDYGWLY